MPSQACNSELLEHSTSTLPTPLPFFYLLFFMFRDFAPSMFSAVAAMRMHVSVLFTGSEIDLGPGGLCCVLFFTKCCSAGVVASSISWVLRPLLLYTEA